MRRQPFVKKMVNNFLVTSQEWDLLKMFVDEFLAFREANEIFC